MSPAREGAILCPVTAGANTGGQNAGAAVAISRHSSCTRQIKEAHDIRTVRELLARRDVSTNTDVVNRGPAAVRSPADRIFGS